MPCISQVATPITYLDQVKIIVAFFINWIAMGLSEFNKARQLRFKKIYLLILKQKNLSQINNASLNRVTK